MTDIVDKQTRSRMMAGIKGKDTQPEMKVRRFLHSQGLRFRLHVRALPGKPDLCLPKHLTVIFIQGCFWHRHKECSLSYSSASNADKWQTKFKQNVQRDRRNINALINHGWRVIILWECGLRQPGTALLEWLPAEIQSGKNILVEWPSKAKQNE